ncbi:MAG: S8 family serine peptidase [Alphaproteobacteria bacterium]|nr:S8 family serine peptidase [Alphaproteobacteria bacterium]
MLTRIVEQWGFTLMIVLIATKGFQRSVEPELLRFALFVGAAHVLYQERLRISAALDTLRERLARLGEPHRPTLSERTLAWSNLGLLGGLCALGLTRISPDMVRLRAVHDPVERGLLLLLLVFACATAVALWTGVVLDRLTLWRRGLAAWRLERAARRRDHPNDEPPAEQAHPEAPTAPLTPVMPLFTAACAGFALAPAFLGIPSPGEVLTAATVAWEAAAPPRDNGVELLLELGEDDAIEEVLGVLLEHGVIPLRAFPGVDPGMDADLAATWRLSVDLDQTPALVEALRSDRENVDRIELNGIVDVDPRALARRCVPGYTSLPVNDPLASAQPELVTTGVDRVLGVLREDPGRRKVRVGLIDTGVDGAHEDLRGVLSLWSARGDRSGHGTQVAGVLAGLADNGRGIASLNVRGELVELMSYPALDRDRARVEDITDAILEAIDDEVDVLNLSFSSSTAAPHVVRRAVAMALDAQIILVASAGNDPRVDASAAWPASLPGVIVVSATDAWGRPALGSSTTTGVYRAIAAPGEGVCTTARGGGYVQVSGTSFAAPMVSSSLALARSLCGDLDADDAWMLLRDTGAQDTWADPLVLRVDQLLAHLLQRGCP